MNILKLFILTILISIITSCAVTKQKIQIDSKPNKANISTFLSSTQQYKHIGNTPLMLNETELLKLIPKDQDFISLRVSKKGHAIEHIIIDRKLRSKLSYIANLNPIEIWTDKDAELSSTIANKLATTVQVINKDIFKKNLKQALGKTEKLINQYPKAPVFYDIKGSILYLMGRKSESLASYARSLALNPDNVQSRKMIERIK
jgi:tetratricopeptide (TPR) repeat protein